MLKVNEEYMSYLSRKGLHLALKRSFESEEVADWNSEPTEEELKNFNNRLDIQATRIKEALNYLLLREQDDDLTTEEMLKLHQKLNHGESEKLPGKFKTDKNAVKHLDGNNDDSTAEPKEVPDLMKKWLKEFNQSLKSEYDMFCISKLFIDFLVIHPFQDGNGNMIRLLSMYYFMSKDLAPPIVTRKDRKHYYEIIRKKDTEILSVFFTTLMNKEKKRYEFLINKSI